MKLPCCDWRTDSGDFMLTDPVNGYFTLKIGETVLQQLSLGSFRPIKHHNARRPKDEDLERHVHQ